MFAYLSGLTSGETKMAMITVAQALDFMQKLEETLAKQYADISGHSRVQVIRQVATCLANHYSYLAKALTRLPKEQYEGIKNATIPFGPQLCDLESLLTQFEPDTNSVESLIDTALSLNRHIAQLYRQVTNQDVSEDIKDLFENLAKFEEIDEHELTKIKALSTY